MRCTSEGARQRLSITLSKHSTQPKKKHRDTDNRHQIRGAQQHFTTSTHAAAGTDTAAADTQPSATHSGQRRIGARWFEPSTQTGKRYENHHGVGEDGGVGPKAGKNEEDNADGVGDFPAAAEVETDDGVGFESVERGGGGEERIREK